MARIDEKQEAIARIRMAIDGDVAARAKIKAEADEDFEEDSESALKPAPSVSSWAPPDGIDGHSPHWIFGSPGNPINTRAIGPGMSDLDNPSFKDFDNRLRDFLSVCLPDEAIRYEDPISVSLSIL
jgi:hypothetical protein